MHPPNGLLQPPFVSLFLCGSFPFFLSFSLPSPPTHCSMMSAGDLIEQIDCKWNRGAWVNQSNIVKQFFGHEGISLAYTELISVHSVQRWPGFQGQAPRPLWLHGEPHTHPSACSTASECPNTLHSLCCKVQLEWRISKLNVDLSIHGHPSSKFHSPHLITNLLWNDSQVCLLTLSEKSLYFGLEHILKTCLVTLSQH